MRHPKEARHLVEPDIWETKPVQVRSLEWCGEINPNMASFLTGNHYTIHNRELILHGVGNATEGDQIVITDDTLNIEIMPYKELEDGHKFLMHSEGEAKEMQCPGTRKDGLRCTRLGLGIVKEPFVCRAHPGAIKYVYIEPEMTHQEEE